MTTYRNFEIEALLYGGYGWAYECDEHYRGHSKTIEECKNEIDAYYADRTHYRVINPTSKTITKFSYLDEAMNFIRKCGGELQFFIDGEEVNFDAI